MSGTDSTIRAATVIALLLVEDLPLARAVDGHELVRGLHDVARVHRQIPIDPLGGVPLLVLAPLVQIEQPLPAVVVLPAEAGGAGGGNVPGAGLDGDGVGVVSAHGGAPWVATCPHITG